MHPGKEKGSWETSYNNGYSHGINTNKFASMALNIPLNKV